MDLDDDRHARTVWVCFLVAGWAVVALLVRERWSPLRGEDFGALAFNVVACLAIGVSTLVAVATALRILRRWSDTRQITRRAVAACIAGSAMGLAGLALLTLVVLGVRPG